MMLIKSDVIFINISKDKIFYMEIDNNVYKK